MQYEYINNVIALLNQFGKDSLVAKIDIKDAFRIIPIHPDDYKRLGFSWEGAFYYDKCLPMGVSSSCQIFESLSQALQWLCIRSLMRQVCPHMLDDFFLYRAKAFTKVSTGFK